MTEIEQHDMELSFSRGFSPGWLEGCDHKRLVPGLSSAKRGVLLGKIDLKPENTKLSKPAEDEEQKAANPTEAIP